MADYLQATIGGIELVVMPLPDWGMVQYEADESDNVYADIATQLTPRASKLRRPSFKAKLTAETKDELIELENELRAELAKEYNTLVLVPRNASKAVTYKLLRNEAAVAAFDYAYDRACVGIYELNLVAEPWGYGPTEAALADEPLETPGVVALPEIIGQGDPRLSVTVTRTWADANGIQFVCVAIAPPDAEVEDFFYQAEAAAAGSSHWYSDAHANAYGGLGARLDSSDTTAWTRLASVVPASGPPPGRYRVWARGRAGSSSEAYIAKRKQYAEARDPATVTAMNPDALTWYDLGEWVHYGSDPLHLSGRCANGTMLVDCVILVPVDDGYVWYDDPDEKDTDWVRFGWLYDHKYARTATPEEEIDASGRMEGHGLKVPREPRSLFIFVERKGTTPAPEILLNATYLPRWEMFR